MEESTERLRAALVAQIALGILNVLLLPPVWLQVVLLYVAELFWVLVVLPSANLLFSAVDSIQNPRLVTNLAEHGRCEPSAIRSGSCPATMPMPDGHTWQVANMITFGPNSRAACKLFGKRQPKQWAASFVSECNRIRMCARGIRIMPGVHPKELQPESTGEIQNSEAKLRQVIAVFGTTSGMGAYTEHLAVKAAAIAKKPPNLSFEEAASVPVASQTAWQGLFTHGHLEKGQTVLIHAGAGAVGAYAVQLASHAGATVVATARGDDEAYLKSIRASRVIDYRKAQFEKLLQEKVDMVFDLIGGDTQKRSFLVLKEGGHLVSAVQPVSQEESAMHRVSGVMMRLEPSGEVLGRIAQLLEDGTLRPDVATVYALQDVAQAWKDIAGNMPWVHGMSPSGPGAARRNSHGKIVLRVA